LLPLSAKPHQNCCDADGIAANPVKMHESPKSNMRSERAAQSVISQDPSRKALS
jgi:hypothetical protein